MKQKSKSILKCIMTFVLTVVMVMGALPLDGLVMEVYAATITPTIPSQDGDGYYLIGTAEELYGFAELVNNGNKTANAKLTADIVVNENVLDANGEANTGDFVKWTPIGNVFYSGTFDGQGHTISGLYVSGSSGVVGLIGTVSGSATIKNLGIVDSYFNSSGNFLGSIVGDVDLQSSVTLANVYSTSTVKGVNWIGGLVGGDGGGSVTIINSYFAGKTSAGQSYGTHHDDLVSGAFGGPNSGTLNIVNTFVLGTSLYGTVVTAEQLSDGTVAAALHYYQDALADGSMFGLSGGKTNFSGTIDGVSVPTANITLHTFTGDTKTYSSKYVVGNTTTLPVNVACVGYNKFAGWYNNANLVGNAVTSISSSETGDKEYWAKYKQSHSVTFVLNDGMIEKGNIDHYIEGEVTPLPAVVRKGDASFEGWYTTPDCSGNPYVAIPATATEDMTFYAKWGEAKTSFYLMQEGEPVPASLLYEGENIVWLDKTTLQSYKIFNNEHKYWGSGDNIYVPYDGGEYAFSNRGNNFRVHQSGFYVFTLTDKGGENWFVSVLKLKSMLNCDVASIPTQVYTGSAIEPAVTVKDGEATLNPDEDYEVTYSNNVSAGTATATITGKGDYSGETAATFTIDKATPYVKTAPTASTITYGQMLSDSNFNNDGVIQYSESIETPVEGTFAWTNSTVKPSVTDSENTEYEVTFTPMDSENFKSVTTNVTLKVNKATPTVTAPIANPLTYNGSEQELITTGSTDFGTLLYSLDGTNYSDAIPTATDAGTYYVWYKVVGDENHVDTEPESILVKILSLFISHSLSLDSDIGVNFYLNLTEAQAAQATVTFTWTKNGSEKTEIVDLSNATKMDNGYYKATCRVSASEISADITATLVIDAGQGETLEATDTYSVARYVDVILDDEEFAHNYKYTSYTSENQSLENLRALASALLAYGDYAKVYFYDNYTAVAPVPTESIPEKYAVYTVDGDLPEGVIFTGATLSLKSKTTLSLYFKKSAGTSAVDLTMDGKTEGEDYERKKSGNEYVIRIRNIAAPELNTAFAVKVNGTTTVTYSPLTYCYKAQNNSDTKLANTVKALYKYWKEANQFFGLGGN